MKLLLALCSSAALAVLHNTAIHTTAAPPGPGGAAQGILTHRGYLATSIQYGVNVTTGKLVSGGATAQMKQAMINIAAVFTAAGYPLKTSGTSCWIYGFDAKTFGGISKEYYTFFDAKTNHPARNPTGAKLAYDGALVGVSCRGFVNGGVRIIPPNFFSTDFNSQGLLVDGGAHLYTSAQLGLDPVSGNLVAGGAVNETCQAMTNIAVVYATAFPELGAKALAGRASECQILLSDDMSSSSGAVVEAFKLFFVPDSPPPAFSITTFPAGALPLPAHVAVTCQGVGTGATRVVQSGRMVVARIGSTTQMQATAQSGNQIGTVFTATAAVFAGAFEYLGKSGLSPAAILQKTATECQLWLAPEHHVDATIAVAALKKLFANKLPALTVTKDRQFVQQAGAVALQCFGSDTNATAAAIAVSE